MGGTSLERKYGVTFYKDFNRLGLQMRNNQEKGKKYTCNSDYFKDIDNEEKAYWFGFIYGDGYLSHTNNSTTRFGLSIMASDYDHMVKFKKAINFNGNISKYKVVSGYKVGVEYCRIIVSDDRFSNNLISHGLIEHKSNIMQAPTGIPEQLIKHWIRGFMDANGSIMITKNNEYCDDYGISFTSTNSVLDFIQRHLFDNNAINKTYPYRKRKKEQIVTQMSFGGNYQVKQFLDYIYSDSCIWLERKHERYLELCQLLKTREDNKRINKCAYCGTTESSEFDMWLYDGEYNGKILCYKHYQQLRKYGRIIPDKKDYCDICGENFDEKHLHRLGPSWGNEWHGKTICEKHYYQLSYYGKIIDSSSK